MDDTAPVDQSPNGWFTPRVDVNWSSRCRPRCLRWAQPVHNRSMFRLRTIVLLWLGRRLLMLVRPTVKRRLRKLGLVPPRP